MPSNYGSARRFRSPRATSTLSSWYIESGTLLPLPQPLSGRAKKPGGGNGGGKKTVIPGPRAETRRPLLPLPLSRRQRQPTNDRRIKSRERVFDYSSSVCARAVGMGELRAGRGLEKFILDRRMIPKGTLTHAPHLEPEMYSGL